MLKLHRLNPVRSSIRAGIRSIRGLGQEWIRTTEGVKPADLQSAPFGRFGTYPDFPLRRQFEFRDSLRNVETPERWEQAI